MERPRLATHRPVVHQPYAYEKQFEKALRKSLKEMAGDLATAFYKGERRVDDGIVTMSWSAADFTTLEARFRIAQGKPVAKQASDEDAEVDAAIAHALTQGGRHSAEHGLALLAKASR